MNMTPEAIYNKAHEEGMKAAYEVEKKLSTYSIHSVDIYGNSIPNTPVFQMRGLCGFAGVNIKPATSKFAKFLVSKGIAKKDSYAGGVTMHVHFFNQVMEMKESFADAFAKVLSEEGIRCYAYSRLD